MNPRPKLGKLVVDGQKRTNWRHFVVFQISQMDSNWSGVAALALKQTETNGTVRCSG